MWGRVVGFFPRHPLPLALHQTPIYCYVDRERGKEACRGAPQARTTAWQTCALTNMLITPLKDFCMLVIDISHTSCYPYVLMCSISIAKSKTKLFQ